MFLIPSIQYKRKARTEVFSIANHTEHILHTLISSFRFATMIYLLQRQL